MALGLEGYGSESDSGIDEGETSAVKTTTTASSSKLKRAPKKIAIGLPSLKHSEEDDRSTEDVPPPAKKARLEYTAGKSSLLSMLPAPKTENPSKYPPARTLGSGSGHGLGFMTSSNSHLSDGNSEARHLSEKGNPTTRVDPSTSSKTINVPPVDFFSLGNTGSASSSALSSSSASKSLMTSAPEIPTFEPPEPSVNDPYPGYYQLPSGKWEAHDSEVYGKFLKKWQDEYNAQVRALEKGTEKGFEGSERDDVAEVNAQKEMERAKQIYKDRDEKKKLTQTSEPSQPKMTMTASKQSGIAHRRHQLSTLLNQAYQNREALEEKIAEGRRNRREAGAKYGF